MGHGGGGPFHNHRKSAGAKQGPEPREQRPRPCGLPRALPLLGLDTAQLFCGGSVLALRLVSTLPGMANHRAGSSVLGAFTWPSVVAEALELHAGTGSGWTFWVGVSRLGTSGARFPALV